MAKKTTKKKEQDIENIDLTAPATEPEVTLPSAGLGDTIKKITNILGIAQCGECKNRQKKYDKLFPWLKISREMTQDEMEFIVDIHSRKSMQSDEANRLFFLYNDLFPSRNPIQRCNCPGTIIKLIERIKNYIE